MNEVYKIALEKLDLESVCRDHGIDFKDKKALCPFPGHDDRNASFSLHNSKTYVYCFGCNKGGDAIWLEYELGRHQNQYGALTALNQRYGLNLKFNGWDEKKAKDYDYGFQLLDWYCKMAHENLLKNEEAQQWLEAKKAISLDDIKKYNIGFVGSSWLCNKATDKNKEIFIKLGLIKEKNGNLYDYFRDRLIFPVYNSGRIASIWSREWPDKKDSSYKWLGLPSSEFIPNKPIAFVENLNCDICMIAESIPDVYSFLKIDVPAVALLGDSVSHANKAYFEKAKAKLYFALDADEAGQEAAYKLAAEYKGHIIDLENDKDADEILAEHGIDEFKAIVEKAVSSAKVVSNEPAEKGDLIDVNEDVREGGSQAERLVTLIEDEDLTLFHDQMVEPFARFKVQDHYQIYKVRSKHFKWWISKLFWDSEGKIPNSESLNSALRIIEAKARFEGDEYQLHNRVAWHDNAIWYDLGNWHAVRIDKDGWSVVNEPPILFRKYSHQKEQALPIDGDGFVLWEELFKFVNISNAEDGLLYVTNLICGLIPDIPHPVDVFVGDQGTAKTTSSRVKKELLDPSELKTLTSPYSMAEFAQLADHHWYIPLDNLTDLRDSLSDALCKAVTGDGFTKRELYSDDDDVIYSFKRCICLNGINMVPTKPDLLDRSLIFELDPIPQTKRIEESTFWKQLNEIKPILLGSIFSTLSKAISGYPKIKLYSKPRMADFARWGCAIAKALGKSEKDFISAYYSNIRTQNKEALDASPVAVAIIEFMNDKPSWEGSPSKLLVELDNVAEILKLDTKEKRYPKDPSWLWRRIKEVRTNLIAVGIIATKDDSRRDSEGRRILIEKIPTSDKDVEDQKSGKNAVSAVMVSESEQLQGVTPDTKADSIKPVEDDTVRAKSLKSLNSDSTDSKDSILSNIDVEGRVKIERLNLGADGVGYKIIDIGKDGKPRNRIIPPNDPNINEIQRLYDEQNRS